MGERRIRVGVVGVGRGMTFAAMAEHVGMELVALCDTWEERLHDAAARCGVAGYTHFDRFLEHEMDAVVLANYYHEHAPLAVRALESGRHVMSECIACKTPAEGVALARAVERSRRIYLFAENYAYFRYVQEMRRLYHAGEIGEVRYAEGEYNHPIDARGMAQLAPGTGHWRNHIPPTYYPTHAMSPIMFVTDTRPVSVNALSIPRSDPEAAGLHVRRGDNGAVILCRLSNGGAARLMGLGLRGHSIWYRFHGTRGLMENLRTGNTDMLRVLHEPWDLRPGDSRERIYLPEFPVRADLAERAGHGGGDFFTSHYFAEAIRTGEAPYLDVYRGLDMTLVGIQAWRSCLAGGAPFEVPDFRSEETRRRYEADAWSPFPEDRGPGQPWPSILGEVVPSAEALAYVRSVWAEMGYHGD
ncbi:MAG: Gfo/Idh/MocA family oxidoreductase [Chthonomonadales bacterium]|nr:Gfo/Idh/MocA family oxidoreductase [Chthonomonadales bacterium]